MPRKFTKDPIPGVGELREPVVLFRVARLPDASAGFTATYTKYANGWARIDEKTIIRLGGVQCNPFPGQKVVMRRNDQLPVEASDVIMWGTRLLRIVNMHPLDDLKRFTVIICREEPNTSGVDFADPTKITVVSSPPAQTEDPARASTHNPYF